MLKLWWFNGLNRSLTELLFRVNILRVVSIDVYNDYLSGAVGQSRVQTGHCNHTRTVDKTYCINEL